MGATTTTILAWILLTSCVGGHGGYCASTRSRPPNGAAAIAICTTTHRSAAACFRCATSRSLSMPLTASWPTADQEQFYFSQSTSGQTYFGEPQRPGRSDQ